MLQLLVVENYAVVERLRVRFHPGLNLLTGETGSGKSIVVDALSLLLGGRASADMIRTGEPQARVAGIFDVRDNGSVRRILDSAGLETEDGELLIEREILASGKSRAFVGSRPVAVALLRELAPCLADIHGQHEQQLLFSADAQRDLLDSFAGNAELIELAADAFRGWRAASSGLAELESSEQEKLRALDLWMFQRREIETASVQPEEDAALESERRVLQNVQRLEEAAATAYGALYDSPQSALALARQAARRVDELCRIDPSLEGLREHLKTADLSLQEAGVTLRDYLTRLEANPQRLEEVETRLAALDRLKRKYGASLAAVVEFLEEVRRQIAAVENAGERMEELRLEQARRAAEFEKLAAELTARRTASARKLEKRVAVELAPLGMERAVFRVELTAAPWTERGTDSVAFLVSANPGEEPRPLEKVASGGEISRLALALKTCLAAARRVGDGGGAQRTLVFDEVDAGVGGSAAEGIGRRLKRLATSAQVLCVTHLPQIASFADHHYRVDKQEVRGRTVATVEELDAAARTREIGRMLSGQTLTPEALKHAAQLIKLSAE
jgi:DNA repair protein RecN (Recombination protein N)